MHLEVIFGHRRREVLELLHDAAQPVGMVALRHQDGIVRRYHDDVWHAEQRDERLVGRHIGTAGVGPFFITLNSTAVR